jgi:hypothetical protein
MVSDEPPTEALAFAPAGLAVLERAVLADMLRLVVEGHQLRHRASLSAHYEVPTIGAHLLVDMEGCVEGQLEPARVLMVPVPGSSPGRVNNDAHGVRGAAANLAVSHPKSDALFNDAHRETLPSKSIHSKTAVRSNSARSCIVFLDEESKDEQPREEREHINHGPSR